jgi:hypothetical protein
LQREGNNHSECEPALEARRCRVVK